MIDSYVKTKNGRQKIRAYTVSECKLPVLNFKEQQKNHKMTKYATRYICLDTETSHINNETGWIYQWAVKFGSLYVYGRRPSEIIELLQKIAEHYNLNADKKIIVYIHNASYDLQYLKAFIREYDPTADFLAIDNHAILQCEVLGFKIICSYKLTNLSLAVLADKYAENYDKAVGEIDYNIVRYQDTPLSIESDWYYMFSDVAAQDDGIQGYLKMQGYRYAFNAPITSTGFVRANCRKAARNVDTWRNEFIESRLDLDQYLLCRQGFMGGVCICSWKYAGVTVRDDNLRHKDFISSYPARQMLDYMPVGAPDWYGDVESEEELEDICAEYCCVFVLTIDNVHIKEGVTAPCIPSSKCIHKEGELKLNGKIVYADTLTIVVCEIDYKWIKKQYDFDALAVDQMLIFDRGEAPAWLKEEVFTYFKYKCTLDDGDILRAKSKNMLNAIYGMTATAIIREVFKMDDDWILHKQGQTRDDKEQALNKYYRSYNNFMPYQLALWTTAHARDALYTMIECVGYDNFLYCDTDSVFYIETPENKKRMEEYAESCIQRAKEKGAYVGEKYLGLPTEEPAIRAFRGLHSKCYAMEEWNKKHKQFELNVVIAGIPKEATKWIDGEPVRKTNAEELGSIDNLEDGFTFVHCGGIRCVYCERPIEHMEINGHMIELSSSAVLENITKDISDTMYTNGKNYECLHIVQEVV